MQIWRHDHILKVFVILFRKRIDDFNEGMKKMQLHQKDTNVSNTKTEINY